MTPLYITRIRISAMEAAKLKLVDAYAWHQTLWRAFPHRDRQPRHFLTRIDRRGRYFEALLLSPEMPQAQSWGQWETREIPPSFFMHDRYQFALRANPTQMRVAHDQQGNRLKHGRRTAIYAPDQLLQWITRKLDQAGCRLETVSFDPPLRETLLCKGKQLVQVRVDFRGVLQVVDRAKFQEAVAVGLGRSRAFGFGMLLLAPLPQNS